MKKKKILNLFLVFLFFIGTNNVFAATRGDKNSKTPLVIQGKTFYAGVEVDFNNHSRVGFIGNIDISYDSAKNAINAKIKRSKINEIVEESDKNVYFNIELNVDYHDYSKDEYTIYSNENGTTYWINQHGKESKDSYIELLSTAVEIYGGIPYTATKPGVIALYKGDFFDSHQIVGDYTPNDLQSQVKEVSLKDLKITFSIDEDVKADMKNIEIIDVGNSDDGSNPVTKENILINNFYQMVDNNAKAILALSMYDEEGNPIELNDNDINVKVDESENVDSINNYFEDHSTDKIRILTFNYKKTFKGKAKIKSYVKDKFKENEKLHIYYYNKENDSMDIVAEDVAMDSEGYISFDTSHFSEYVIASSDNKLVSALKTTGIKTSSNSLNKYILYSLLGVVVLILLIFVLRKNKKAKNNNNVENNDSDVSNDDNNVSNDDNNVSNNDNDVSNPDNKEVEKEDDSNNSDDIEKKN